MEYAAAQYIFMHSIKAKGWPLELGPEPLVTRANNWSSASLRARHVCSGAPIAHSDRATAHG
jgi:hypothetical protein